MTDEDLDAFLSRMAADPDTKMAQAAIAELIQSPQTSLEQLSGSPARTRSGCAATSR